MKTKASNKLNIVLIAITLLLLFVMGISLLGKTHSWLETKQEITFTLTVPDINIIVKQGDRTVADEGYIYLGTDTIKANTIYNIDDVTITNDEPGTGYYIRFQAIAMVNGEAYNINNCITGEFYNRNDGWMYSVDDATKQTPTDVAMEGEETLTMIESIKFPSSFVSSVQGQYFKLHLFIEGSATVFSD